MLLIFFSLTVSTVVLFAGACNKPVYDVLAPWKKKDYEQLFFCFVLLVLSVIVFACNRLRQSPILLGKMKSYVKHPNFHSLWDLATALLTVATKYALT